MKKTFKFLLLIFGLLFFTACDGFNFKFGNDDEYKLPNPLSELTCKDVASLKIENNSTTPYKYYITGVIIIIEDEQLGTLYISDENGKNWILVEKLYSADGNLIFGSLDEKPNDGDTIVILANVSNKDNSNYIEMGNIVDIVVDDNSGNEGGDDTGNEGGDETGNEGGDDTGKEGEPI